MIKLNLSEELKKKAYLKGKSLRYQKFKPDFPNDHTFCVFCWSRISEWEEDLHGGNFESESRNWICENCTDKYQKAFEWEVEETPDSAWRRLLRRSYVDLDLL